MNEPMIDGIGLNLTSLADGRMDLLPAMLADWAAAGCSHVEVSARKVDLVVGGRLHVARTEALAAMVADAGLVPVVHANHAINLMHPTDADMHQRVAEANIAACARLGARSMVLHSGTVPKALFDAEGVARLAGERDRLRRLGDLAGAAGVRLAVENLYDYPGSDSWCYGASPARLAEQLAEVGHEWVGACLDFGHAWLAVATLKFDYLAELEALSPFVWHLHLHDNCGRPDPSEEGGDAAALGLGDMHAPMFMGTIPWHDLLPRMRFRPRTFGGIELNGRYNAAAASVVATAHAMAAHLNSGAELVNPYREAAE